jgi:hypothetical protein
MINIHETAEWSNHFTAVIFIAIKKKPKATKCNDHETFDAHTATIVERILRRRIERNIEEVLEEGHFGFRRGTGTRDAIGMLQIISEQTLRT